MGHALLSCGSLLLCIATAYADPVTVALFDSLTEKLKAARSLTVTYEFRETDLVGKKEARKVYTLRLLKPNYFQMVSGKDAFYGDGKTIWTYDPIRRLSWPQPAPGEGMAVPSLVGFEAFTKPTGSPYRPGARVDTSFEGEPCQAIPLGMEGMPPTVAFHIYLNPRTHLPVGWVMKDRYQLTVGIYRDVRLDDALTPEQFAWKPPEPAVKVGMSAPRFTLPTLGGETLHLAEALSSHKGVLISFWAGG